MCGDGDRWRVGDGGGCSSLWTRKVVRSECEAWSGTPSAELPVGDASGKFRDEADGNVTAGIQNIPTWIHSQFRFGHRLTSHTDRRVCSEMERSMICILRLADDIRLQTPSRPAGALHA